MRSYVFLFVLYVAVSSSIGEQESIAVTIYNDDFAMVKDVRSITFDEGNSFLYFTDVSANIQTETVTFKALDDPNSIRVFEQNFERNLVNTKSILEKYIEQEITIFAEFGDNFRRRTGKLLGYDSGYIMEIGNSINVYNRIAGVEFSGLPDGFFTKPTLNWKVWSLSERTTPCEVAYRTTGFKWKADYSISLNQKENRGDLGGWVTIDNYSGKKYESAKLKLIAGDVNTVRSQPVLRSEANFAFAKAAPAPPSFSQKSFADYHLYTLSSLVTLNESSQKQVEFIPKVYDLPIWKYHEIRINSGGYSQERLDATNKLNFLNGDENGLGIPFPKGIVRVFKEDEDDGSLEFIGEDRIDHTPKDENITLTTGNAFDIVADKYSEKRERLDNSGSYRAEMNMTVKNRKDTEAEVIVIYSNGYGDNLKIDWKSNDIEL